jgi:hypothetical protein
MECSFFDLECEEDVSGNFSRVENFEVGNLYKNNLLVNIDMRENFTLDEVVFLTKNKGEIALRKNLILPNQIITEILSSQISSEIMETYSIELNTTLLPGSTIIIDSEFFTAIMDNKNCLEAYSGAWIFLDRKTSDIHVDSGSKGTLKGRILYSERWL